jgi:hypothetical protein
VFVRGLSLLAGQVFLLNLIFNSSSASSCQLAIFQKFPAFLGGIFSFYHLWRLR